VRILANENVPGRAVAALRLRGHDVRWARTDSPGATESRILDQAEAEKRLLVTFDKDFGELAFRRRLPSSCGIVLFRLPMDSPEDAARSIVTILESRQDWAGYFSVVEKDRLRMRPLSSAVQGPSE